MIGDKFLTSKGGDGCESFWVQKESAQLLNDALDKNFGRLIRVS